MNKKGFTLVEIILVVVILGILSAITIPNIMESLRQNKIDAGENVHKILLENLKLYTMEKKDEWWCDPTSSYGVVCNSNSGRRETGDKIVSLETLKEFNQDIDISANNGECNLIGDMTVKREGSNGNYNYSYTVKVKCTDKTGVYYES